MIYCLDIKDDAVSLLQNLVSRIIKHKIINNNQIIKIEWSNKEA